ncbi:hypothetical protein MTO96_001363 [Rhipicephalus appendiculatus]
MARKIPFIPRSAEFRQHCAPIGALSSEPAAPARRPILRTENGEGTTGQEMNRRKTITEGAVAAPPAPSPALPHPARALSRRQHAPLLCAFLSTLESAQRVRVEKEKTENARSAPTLRAASAGTTGRSDRGFL